MEVHNRCSTRRLILCLAVPTGLALMAMLAPSLVAAQGTPQQRAACEDEAKWLCSNYIPDEGAISAMEASASHIRQWRLALLAFATATVAARARRYGRGKPPDSAVGDRMRGSGSLPYQSGRS